jgi:predicted secreted protein
MSLTLGLALYFIIWWTVLFAVLPFGVYTQAEAGEIVPGTPASAPMAPRMLRTFAITTVVACVVSAVAYVVIAYDIIGIGTWIIEGGPSFDNPSMPLR